MNSTEGNLKIPKKGVKYKIGDSVNFYEDYQNDDNRYGEGILLERIEKISPLTFVIIINYES